jgi:hypothetical protein
MSEPDAVPLPREGEVFFDVRGEARSMRLSWYANSKVAVFSIWQGNRCTGTFRLPFVDLARMVQTLQSGPPVPGQQPASQSGHGYSPTAASYDSALDPGSHFGQDQRHDYGARPSHRDFGPAASHQVDQSYPGSQDFGAGHFRPGQDYGTGHDYGRGQDYGSTQGYGAGHDYGAGQDYGAGHDYGAGQDYGTAGHDYGSGPGLPAGTAYGADRLHGGDPYQHSDPYAASEPYRGSETYDSGQPYGAPERYRTAEQYRATEPYRAAGQHSQSQPQVPPAYRTDQPGQPDYDSPNYGGLAPYRDERGVAPGPAAAPRPDDWLPPGALAPPKRGADSESVPDTAMMSFPSVPARNGPSGYR